MTLDLLHLTTAAHAQANEEPMTDNGTVELGTDDDGVYRDTAISTKPRSTLTLRVAVLLMTKNDQDCEVTDSDSHEIMRGAERRVSNWSAASPRAHTLSSPEKAMAPHANHVAPHSCTLVGAHASAAGPSPLSASPVH